MLEDSDPLFVTKKSRLPAADRALGLLLLAMLLATILLHAMR